MKKHREDNLENQDKIEQKKKISKYEIFRRAMLTVCICLTAALALQLSISIVDYVQARISSSEILEGVSDITTPEEEFIVGSSPITDFDVEVDVNSSYSEYFSEWLEIIKETKQKHPDFVGYIEIENLDILYPILKSDDNVYYLDHLIDGTKNKSGEIFMDYRNNPFPLTDNQNIVLYGHNMSDGTKFHNLTKLRKEEYYYNSPINIITEDGIFTFTVFSFYRTDNNADFTPLTFDYESNFGMFCVTEQAKSMYESNFKFTGKEVILTLSTCVNDFGGRWCTHAVLTSITK